MSIKKAMQGYFSLRKELADEGLDFLFMTPFLEDVDPLIYAGEVDEEGYVTWNPVEKREFHDLKTLEEALDTRIHPSIIEYFNAYWFVDLEGFIQDHNVNLESVQPGKFVQSFRDLLIGYKNNHDSKLAHIPIGIEGDGLIVVVDNEDGSVKFEDFERNSYEVLSESLEQLISTLRLKR